MFCTNNYLMYPLHIQGTEDMLSVYIDLFLSSRADKETLGLINNRSPLSILINNFSFTSKESYINLYLSSHPGLPERLANYRGFFCSNSQVIGGWNYFVTREKMVNSPKQVLSQHNFQRKLEPPKLCGSLSNIFCHFYHLSFIIPSSLIYKSSATSQCFRRKQYSR